jgi:hypothetical protein
LQAADDKHGVERNVLAYAAAAEAPRSFRRINGVAGVFSGLLVCLFYVSLVPLAESFAYNRRIPLWEAVGSAFGCSPLKFFGNPYVGRLVWFVPMAAGVAVVFIMVRGARAKLVVAGIAVLMVAAVVEHSAFWMMSPPIFLMSVPRALIGQCDGEEWSEGFVTYGVIGGWTILWLLLGAALVWTSRRGRRGGVIS